MGETDVETGPEIAISQTPPTRSRGANVRRAALSIFKMSSLLPFIKHYYLDTLLPFFKNYHLDLLLSVLKDYYLPVFFGTFGIFALQAAGVANDQSIVANQLALLSLCYGNSVIFLNLFYERIHY
jgi:hypothetical protein